MTDSELQRIIYKYHVLNKFLFAAHNINQLTVLPGNTFRDSIHLSWYSCLLTNNKDGFSHRWTVDGKYSPGWFSCPGYDWGKPRSLGGFQRASTFQKRSGKGEAVVDPQREQFPVASVDGEGRKVSLTEPLGKTDENTLFCGFKTSPALLVIVTLIHCGLCGIVHIKTQDATLWEARLV